MRTQQRSAITILWMIQVAEEMAKESGRTEVRVNTENLVHNILSNYSSPFFILRELIQNADDAGATNVRITLSTAGTLARCTVTNDGRPLSDEDWERLTTIAEGNKGSDKIGYFGVGFYTVFGCTDHPEMHSGEGESGRAIRFDWQANELGSKKLMVYDIAPGLLPGFSTMVALNIRSGCDAQEWNKKGKLQELRQFLVRSVACLNNVIGVELWVDNEMDTALHKIENATDNTVSLPPETARVSRPQSNPLDHC